MKILLVTQRFRPLIGGAETVLAELARELARQGHDVTVLTARWEVAWPARERVDNVTIERLPWSPVRFWGTWKFLRDLRRWFFGPGRAFDVWYVSMLKHAAWSALGASRRCRVPVVLRPEGSGATGDVAWQARALGGRLIRRRCRRGDAFVANSPHIRAELVSAGIPERRIHEIPNGVPVPREPDDIDRMAWRQRLGLNSAGPVVVFTGRLSPEKGVGDLIAAWRIVREELPRATLAIVGSGPEESALRHMADGIENVAWVGATQQPQRFLFAADLFVLPSREEGMSISLLEAMAAGLPIVATDIPGNRLSIESGRHGILVPADRPEQLARSILVQLRARTLALAMGRAARLRVEDEFSITRMAERHLDLFRSLIAPKNA